MEVREASGSSAWMIESMLDSSVVSSGVAARRLAVFLGFAAASAGISGASMNGGIEPFGLKGFRTTFAGRRIDNSSSIVNRIKLQDYCTIVIIIHCRQCARRLPFTTRLLPSGTRPVLLIVDDSFLRS